MSLVGDLFHLADQRRRKPKPSEREDDVMWALRIGGYRKADKLFNDAMPSGRRGVRSEVNAALRKYRQRGTIPAKVTAFVAKLRQMHQMAATRRTKQSVLQ